MEFEEQSSIRIRTLRLMVRPVITYCLRRGLSAQDLFEVIKRVFVELASDEIHHSGEKLTVSRLSVMTGIRRKEINRVTTSSESELSSSGVAIRVIGQWEQDRRFQTKGGKPRALTFEGEDSDFTKLVRLISSDIGPATILFELERRGFVKHSRGRLKLVETAFIVRDDIEAGFEMLARDASDLVEAVEENLFGDCKIPNLHGRTEYDNVASTALPKIRDWLLTEGTKFHQKAREFVSQYDKDVNASLRHEEGAKVVLSTFSNVSDP